MANNFLKLGYRNFKKNKGYTFINIFGLSVGIAAFILIFLYVDYEYNWDAFNNNYDRIYRVETVMDLSGELEVWNQTPIPLAKSIQENFPEVEKAVCLGETWSDFLSSTKELTFHENRGFFTDKEFFDIFSVEFISGSHETALEDPFSIVLTESLAKKYFPNEDAIGKIIRIDNTYNYKVTALIKDLPDNSNHGATYYLSYASFEKRYGWDRFTNWSNYSQRTYVLLKNNDSFENLSEKIKDYLNEFDKYHKSSLYLKPLSDIHLLPSDDKGLLVIVILYSTIAILTLLLAGVNYMNLTTAYSITRTKEIAIKKVAGGTKRSLIIQFLSETLLITGIALIIGFTLAEVFTPLFANIVDRSLEINYISDWPLIFKIIGIAVVLGLLSGSYPAFYLSAFHPAKIMKPATLEVSKYKFLKFRKILVVFQFVITVSLVLLTITIKNQIDYMRTKDMGFEKENILHFSINHNDSDSEQNFDQVRGALIKHPEINNASISYNIPFSGSWGWTVTWEGSQTDEQLNCRYNRVGYNFLDVFKMKLAKGRSFSREMNEEYTCIINETAVQRFGWDEPIGKRIDTNYVVVGVVKDFHPNSPYNRIPPYIMTCHEGNMSGFGKYSVKITGKNTQEIIEYIKSTFEEFCPEVLFEISILEDDFHRGTLSVYESIKKTVSFFSIITIIIAVIGLFALVSFSVKRKVKEIGIRKSLGATISEIYKLLSTEFFWLYLISLCIALPLDYFSRDIDPAYYKPDFNYWDYFNVSLFTLLIVIITISFQVIKVSRTNPVDSLRYE